MSEYNPNSSVLFGTEYWRIGKDFDFCYGHRVWTQELDPSLSLETQCACRFVHGHQGKAIVYLHSNSITNGMVTDFKHLNWFKKFIDDVLDHKFIVDIDDPLLFESFLPFLKGQDSLILQNEGHYISPVEDSWAPHYKELHQGVVVVPFVPTSENLAKWFYKIVQEKLKSKGILVGAVELYETPKSRAFYSLT